MHINRAFVSAVIGLVSSSQAAGQPGRVSVYVLPDAVPGISGPYTFDAIEDMTVNNNGRVAFGSLLKRTNSANRRGLFVMGGGIALTNVADTNTDTAATEFGVDGIDWLSFSSSLRDDNSVRFYAGLDTPFPAADGIDSTAVELEWAGGQPVVIHRRTADIYAAGSPVAEWHRRFFSPDGATTWIYNGNTTSTSDALWPALADGTIGERFMRHQGPAATDGDPLPGLPTATVRFPEYPVVGDSGAVAFVGRLAASGLPQTYVAFFGREGEGYGPLFDPRQTATEFPGAPAGSRFDRSIVLGITADDTVRVRASFVDTVTGDPTGSGIWSFRDDGTPAVPLLREGHAAPGLMPGEVVLTTLQSVTYRRTFAMIEDSHLRVLVTVGDGATGDERYVVYDIAPDDSITPVYFSSDVVDAPDLSGGPYTVSTINSRYTFWTRDGRLVTEAHLATATDPFAKRGLLHIDESGTARPLAILAEPFDFEPAAPGGERLIDRADLLDVSSEGRVLMRVREAGDDQFAYAVIDINASQCPVDVNSDGLVTPADFNAWILAFNAGAPECDQNGDGLCSPSDFNAWILNYNAGC